MQATVSAGKLEQSGNCRENLRDLNTGILLGNSSIEVIVGYVPAQTGQN